tara:strand:- start:1859 stop:2305 length:447 start_codon:yes stop_codon:yes gene_type:complete
MLDITNNFINPDKCNFLINFFKDHIDLIKSHHTTKALNLSDRKLLPDLQTELNLAVEGRGVEIDWCEIVQWPTWSFQPFHYDFASKETKLTSVVNLNEDFEGGNTMFIDGTIIAPKKGRIIFFDGVKELHRVTQVTKGERYTLAIWYK